jgi:hypothetical protein
MLIVVSILLIITVAVVAVFPRFNEDRKLSRAADGLAQWLLTAKQRAKRDQVPTGIRLFPDPQHNGLITQVQYIQQPDDFTGGSITLGPTYPNGPTAPPVLLAANSNGTIDFQGGFLDPTLWPVQPGDYLSVKGQLHLITNVSNNVLLLASPSQQGAFTSGTTMTLANAYPLAVGMYVNCWTTGGGFAWPPNTVQITRVINTSVQPQIQVKNAPNPPPGGTLPLYLMPGPSSWIPNGTGMATATGGGATKGYSIIRAPRVLSGETPLDLPESICIDPTVSIPPWSSPTSQGSLDIMFAPDGRMMSPTGLDHVILWVRDYTKDAGSPGEQFLILIQAHTGFIAQHPVDTTSGNPYSFTQDARSSGL